MLTEVRCRGGVHRITLDADWSFAAPDHGHGSSEAVLSSLAGEAAVCPPLLARLADEAAIWAVQLGIGADPARAFTDLDRVPIVHAQIEVLRSLGSLSDPDLATWVDHRIADYAAAWTDGPPPAATRRIELRLERWLTWETGRAAQAWITPPRSGVLRVETGPDGDLHVRCPADRLLDLPRAIALA